MSLGPRRLALMWLATTRGKTVGHNICLAGLIAGLLHSVAGCREGEAAEDPETPGTTVQETERRQAEVGGHYFGVYEIGGLRQSAWLHLDTDSVGGAIYDSRRLLRVCALRIAAGAVAFSTGEDFRLCPLELAVIWRLGLH